MLALALGIAALTGSFPSAGDVRDWGESLGPAAPVLFVPLFVVVNFVVAWPILAGASGLLFGTPVGTAVALAGVTLSALAQMAVTRHLAGDHAGRLLPARVERWERLIERRGTLAVMYSRLVPALPFGLVNYGAGVTNVTYRAVALGTLVGAVPKVFAYVALGGSLDDLGAPEAKVALGLLVVIAVFGLLAARRQLRADA